jgi:hypothetical protein
MKKALYQNSAEGSKACILPLITGKSESMYEPRLILIKKDAL